MRMFRVHLIFTALSFFIGVSPVLSQGVRVVCISSKGALTVREKKCLSSETKATMGNLPQQGAKGAAGAAGQKGLGSIRVERIADDFLHFVGVPQSRVFAFCNDDEVVLHGGCACFSEISCNSRITSSGPMPFNQSVAGRSGWRCATIAGIDESADAGSYRAYAVCAQAN